MKYKKRDSIKYISACLLFASCDEINLDVLTEEVALTSDPEAVVSFVDTRNSNALILLNNTFENNNFYDHSNISMLFVNSHPQYFDPPGLDEDFECNLDYRFRIDSTGIEPLKLSNVKVTKITDYSSFDSDDFNYTPSEAVFSIKTSPTTNLDVGESTHVVVNFLTPSCRLTAFASGLGTGKTTTEEFRLSFNTNDLDTEYFEFDIDVVSSWS